MIRPSLVNSEFARLVHQSGSVESTSVMSKFLHAGEKLKRLSQKLGARVVYTREWLCTKSEFNVIAVGRQMQNRSR